MNENMYTHLLDIVACFGTGLDKHHAELLGPLFPLLNCDLPVRGKTDDSNHHEVHIRLQLYSS